MSEAGRPFFDLSVELLRRGYGVRFQASGSSMHPTIKDGETITIAPIRAEEIRRGDIVLYQTERKLIAHRVVKIIKSHSKISFILCGDSAIQCDKPITAQQILGKVDKSKVWSRNYFLRLGIRIYNTIRLQKGFAFVSRTIRFSRKFSRDNHLRSVCQWVYGKIGDRCQ